MTEDDSHYFRSLKQALILHAENLEVTHVIRFRDEVRNMETSLKSLYKILLERKILQTDPFHNEGTLIAVKMPSSEPFEEKNSLKIMSQRFSQYMSQWEFLVNMAHIKLANITLQRLDIFAKLQAYIKWDELMTNSEFIMTRTMAQFLLQVNQIPQPQIQRLIQTELTKLKNHTLALRRELKKILFFLQERYKYKIREHVIQDLHISPQEYREDLQGIMDKIRAKVKENPQKISWREELVGIVLEEDLGENKEALREKTLKSLVVEREKKKEPEVKKIDKRMFFLNILNELVTLSGPLRKMADKMDHNAKVLQNRRTGFFPRLKLLLFQLFKGKEQDFKFTIQSKDPSTGMIRDREFNYTSFYQKLIKKIRLFDALQDKNDPQYKHCQKSKPEQLETFLNRQIYDLKGIYYTNISVNDYFQGDDIHSTLKSEMKGFSTNLKTTQKGINKANRGMKQWAEEKKEADQLEKIGIKT